MTSSYSLASLVNRSESADLRRKFLIFPVGKLNLALPVESVQKVLHYTPMQGSGTTSVGIIHLEQGDITTIDLHKRLFKTSQPLAFESRKFLILAKNSIHESFGIIVEETPILRDIPLSQIRVLPDSYRRADTLDMASHVMQIQISEQLLTVFILEVDCLVPIK